MSDHMDWEKIEELVRNTTASGYDSRTNYARLNSDSRNALRREFNRLRSAADERETLRKMLVESGIENARLTVAVEQERELAKASARRAEVAEYELSLVTAVAGPPEPDGDKEVVK